MSEPHRRSTAGCAKASRGWSPICSKALDQERLGGHGQGRRWAQRLRDLDVAPLLGQALSAAIADGRHVPLLDGIVRWGGEDARGQRASDPRDGPRPRQTRSCAGPGSTRSWPTRSSTGCYKMLAEMAADPEHPVRTKAEEGLETLAHDLQHDPETQARVDADQGARSSTIRRWRNGRGAVGTGARRADAAGAQPQ